MPSRPRISINGLWTSATRSRRTTCWPSFSRRAGGGISDEEVDRGGIDVERISFAKEQVKVASADVSAAAASLKESEEILGKYQAEVDRWDAEVKRLESQVALVVIDKRVLFESTNQLKSSAAARTRPSRQSRKPRLICCWRRPCLARPKSK